VRAAAILLIVLAVALPCAVRAAAEECRPVRRAETAVALAGTAPLVTMTVNRGGALFLLDTGAERTILTAEAAKRLKVEAHGEYPRRMRSLGGNVSSGDAHLRNVQFAGMTLDDFRILVAAISFPRMSGSAIDGLLGADFLSSFDLDLDLPRRRLILYDRLACALAAPPWGQPFSRIPVNRSLHDRLFFPVLLDGHRVTALIDTGAQRTAIDLDTAAKLGVGPAALARDPVTTLRGVASEVVKSWAHRFGRLEVGGESVRDPIIVVTRLGLQDADLVLGSDFLRNRRIWLSYGAHQILLGRPE
jgi:predicted aspartyl protease